MLSLLIFRLLIVFFLFALQVPTQVVSPPQNLTVWEGQTVKFTCTATADPEELLSLQIRWLFDGSPITDGDRLSVDPNDNSLNIFHARRDDAGVYTCLAACWLDSDQASSTLTVNESE